jgi:hypothetical protein
MGTAIQVICANLAGFFQRTWAARSHSEAEWATCVDLADFSDRNARFGIRCQRCKGNRTGTTRISRRNGRATHSDPPRKKKRGLHTASDTSVCGRGLLWVLNRPKGGNIPRSRTCSFRVGPCPSSDALPTAPRLPPTRRSRRHLVSRAASC